MQRKWRALVRRLAATVTVGGLLLTAGYLTAQTPSLGASVSVPAQNQDEIARLFPSVKGDLFRLLQSEGDPRAGGGNLLLSAARPPDAWETLIQIRSSIPGVSVRDGDLAIGSGGEMALVYRWWRHTPRSKQVRLTRSGDGGKTWNQPSEQLDGSGQAFDPRIAWVKGKGLVVVWSDERRGNRLFDIYARRSPDGGTTWEPEQVLSRFTRNGPNDLYARPQMLSDGGDRLWAVWVGLRGTKSFLFLNRSLDGGRTWTDPTLLSGESRSVFGQTLHRTGDHMLLVWHDTAGEPDRIYAVSSGDAGATWTLPVRVDHLPAGSPAASSSTVLLNPDGEALVAWQDARNGREDIFLSRSTDWGRTWSTEDQRIDMDEPGTAISRFPKLTKAPDSRVAIAWEDDRAGFEAVYVRVRSAGQKPEWGSEVLVAPSTTKVAARIPDLAWGSGGLYVSWQVWDHALGRLEKRVASRILHLDSR